MITETRVFNCERCGYSVVLVPGAPDPVTCPACSGGEPLSYTAGPAPKVSWKESFRTEYVNAPSAETAPDAEVAKAAELTAEELLCLALDKLGEGDRAADLVREALKAL